PLAPPRANCDRRGAGGRLGAPGPPTPRRTGNDRGGATSRPPEPHASETTPPGPPPAKGMTWVPGGTFLMGSEQFYPEEAPVHRVTVDGFWMDRTPVT